MPREKPEGPTLRKSSYGCLQILVELQRLNASIAASKGGTQEMTEPDRSSYDSDDDEELEEYE